MICPLTDDLNCCESKCAWWCASAECCAVRMIAENGIADAAGEYPYVADDETDMADRGAGYMSALTDYMDGKR